MTPEEIVRLSDKLKVILSQESQAVQIAALADCVAYWLAGHMHVEDHHKTTEVRRTLLDGFVSMVRRLLPIADQMVREHLSNLRKPPIGG